MKLWYKIDPTITAETLSEEPINGLLPVRVFAPEGEPSLLYAIVDPSEWSTSEIVPAPGSVPETGYLLVYGDDVARPKYLFLEKETDAAVAAATRHDSFGYVPISIQRNAMTEPLKAPPVE